MIRINLLGAPKAKGKRGAGAASAAAVMDVGNAGSLKLKVIVVVLVAGALNAGYWYRLNQQQKSIDTQMKAAVQKNQELADVKVRYMERQKEADNYKRRVDVIDQLRSSQTGPVNLLDTIGTTVNSTEAVWLSKMDDSGPAIDIQGMALSADAVANLMENLKKTGYFGDIEIKETYQDPQVKDMQAFQFTLTCQKAKS
jgi:Tfp pilus assembly protein PilN